MKVRHRKVIELFSSDGDGCATLRFCYDNRGEPYREGGSFDFSTDQEYLGSYFIDSSEMVRLAATMLSIMNDRQRQEVLRLISINEKGP